MKNNYARVAQLVEQLICNQPVVGSSPISGSGAVAQLGENILERKLDVPYIYI
tara:strand:- start:126 stop:284 length:159 start_codon:yes stop_codon:yes gene_type:complete